MLIPYELTTEHADVINRLLPTCEYVTGIRENETGEVRFCPQTIKWDGENSLLWWSDGNMSCDCNRELIFRRQVDDCDYDDDNLKCSDGRFTVVGIWLPDGSDYRDLQELNGYESQ